MFMGWILVILHITYMMNTTLFICQHFSIASLFCNVMDMFNWLPYNYDQTRIQRWDTWVSLICHVFGRGWGAGGSSQHSMEHFSLNYNIYIPHLPASSSCLGARYIYFYKHFTVLLFSSVHVHTDWLHIVPMHISIYIQ